MSLSPEENVTGLLEAWRAGAEDVSVRLAPVIHRELRRVARARMPGRIPETTAQTAALVDEAYLGLVGADERSPHVRARFRAACAQAVRQMLVSAHLAESGGRRGTGSVRVLLPSGGTADAPGRMVDVLALDDALTALAAEHPQAARVAEVRCFAELSLEESAEALGLARAEATGAWEVAATRLAGMDLRD